MSASRTTNDEIVAMIADQMAAQGIGVRELARRSGISPNVISRKINQAKGLINIEEFVRIADALERDISDLLPAA